MNLFQPTWTIMTTHPIIQLLYLFASAWQMCSLVPAKSFWTQGRDDLLKKFFHVSLVLLRLLHHPDTINKILIDFLCYQFCFVFLFSVFCFLFSFLFFFFVFCFFVILMIVSNVVGNKYTGRY